MEREFGRLILIDVHETRQIILARPDSASFLSIIMGRSSAFPISAAAAYPVPSRMYAWNEMEWNGTEHDLPIYVYVCLIILRIM
jgi:hypothetical protein